MIKKVIIIITIIIIIIKGGKGVRWSKNGPFGPKIAQKIKSTLVNEKIRIVF